MIRNKYKQIRCTSDPLQSRKPMGNSLPDKTAGSIISVLPVITYCSYFIIVNADKKYKMLVR